MGKKILAACFESVTARTASHCQLLQIRVPALRLMKRKSKALKQRLDAIYRQRALFAQMKSTPLFRHSNDFFLEGLKEVVELMLTHRVGALPVCDLDTGDLLGIVSYVDVLRSVQESLETA